MKKLLLVLVSVFLLAPSAIADVLTSKKTKATYTFVAEKPVNFEITLKSPRDKCEIIGQVYDDNNKRLLRASHKMQRAKDVFNLPVKTGTYYFEITGSYTCYDKPFEVKLNQISGNFEEEQNNRTSQATLLKESEFTTGYQQDSPEKGIDVDFYKIELTESGILKLVLKYENIGETQLFLLQLLDQDSNKITSVESPLNKDGLTQYVGLTKGDYFVKIYHHGTHNKVVGVEYKLAYILNKGSFIELENNEKPIHATSIVSNQYIKGYFQRNEYFDKDYYKYEAEEGKFTLVFEHDTYDFAKVSRVDISIFDANQKRIESFRADTKKLREEFSFDLKSGTYFISFEPSSRTTGEAYKFGLLKAEQASASSAGF